MLASKIDQMIPLLISLFINNSIKAESYSYEGLLLEALDSSCEWVSEVNPDAIIRIHAGNQTGSYIGNLIWKGEELSPWFHSRSNGYSTIYWNLQSKFPKGIIIPFVGNIPARTLVRSPFPHPKELKQKPRKVLISGLGGGLWYSGIKDIRKKEKLLAAAEGFWKARNSCGFF